MSQLVSVIIPTYNRAYCLGATVDSALAQTHCEVEVLVVDDGSSDQTREFVLDQYRHEPRVRYLYQENTGVSGARNHGLRAAQGDFIAFLDSDDLWLPWKLELQLNVLRHWPEAGMVWTDMDAVGSDGSLVAPRYLRQMYHAYDWFPQSNDLFQAVVPLRELAPALASVVTDRLAHCGDIFSQMLMGNLVHTSTVLIRRERFNAVRSFREDLRYAGEDYDFHLRTCRAGQVAFADVVSIKYQVGRSDQLTRDEYKIHVAENFFKTVQPVFEQERDRIKLPPAMISHMFAEAHSWYGEKLLETGKQLRALHHLGASVRLRPWQPRTWGLLGLACVPPSFGEWTRRGYRFTKQLLGGLF
jgi:glycosyltransferase involved in cell wall biosynthesis